MKKNIRAIALALGISASSLFLTGCGEEYEHSVLFQSILDDTKDDTCLDEILKEEDEKSEGFTALQMFILEKYLVLSEKLHALNLDEFQEENSNLDEEKQDVEKELLDLTGRISMISTWEMDIETLEYLTPTDAQYPYIARELKNGENEINKWLYQDGYATTMRMAYLVSKAKLVDAFSLDKSEYQNFSILENPEDFNDFFSIVKVKYTDYESKSEYYYELKHSSKGDCYLDGFFGTSDENKLAQMIYVVNESKKLDSDKTLPEKGKFPYNEELNNNLTKFAGVIKSGMFANFKVENGKIIQYPENDKVNNIYKEKTKSFNGQ